MRIEAATRLRALTYNTVLHKLAQAVRGEGKLTTNSCHGAVASYIKAHSNQRDNLVWIFGFDNGEMAHVILTDNRNKVLVDTMSSKNGGPYGDSYRPDFHHNLYVVSLEHGMWEYQLLSRVSVSDLIQNY